MKKTPCWLIGHRPFEVQPSPVTPNEYTQTCRNCGKVQAFKIGESGRFANSAWR